MFFFLVFFLGCSRHHAKSIARSEFASWFVLCTVCTLVHLLDVCCCYYLDASRAHSRPRRLPRGSWPRLFLFARRQRLLFSPGPSFVYTLRPSSPVDIRPKHCRRSCWLWCGWCCWWCWCWCWFCSWCWWSWWCSSCWGRSPCNSPTEWLGCSLVYDGHDPEVLSAPRLHGPGHAQWLVGQWSPPAMGVAVGLLPGKNTERVEKKSSSVQFGNAVCVCKTLLVVDCSECQALPCNLSIYRSIYQSIDLSIYLFIYLSI